MKILVGQHELKIDKKDKVNQNEYKVTKCEFEFDEAITNDLVKIALFTNSAGTYKQYIINNECDIPAEILEKQETTTLGVYAYKEENEELELRYSPEEIKFYVSNGSYKEDAENTEPITPTDKEQMEQALQNGLNNINNKIDEVDEKLDGIETAIEETNNLNLDVSDKVDGDVTVTLTKKDASTKTVVISDGTSLQFMWQGTSLGIKTDDMEEYVFVDLQGIQGIKGDTGEPFTIKKTYSSVAEMNADFNNMEYGDYVMIASSVEVEDNAKLYTRGESQWIFITDFSGATGIRGPVGATPNIQIGSVTSGSTPSVTRTGTDENPVLNFVLQPGPQGEVGPTGLTGNGISSIEKTSTSGLVDTYTITYTNGNTTTFNVSNGNGIDRIEKTATVGNKDTYTIYFTNGSTTTYEVSNGEVTKEELEEEVERLSMIYNAFPSTPGEGEEPSINGTAEVPFKEIGLKGNTSQESTTGKNKLNVPSTYAVTGYQKISVNIPANTQFTLSMSKIVLGGSTSSLISFKNSSEQTIGYDQQFNPNYLTYTTTLDQDLAYIYVYSQDGYGSSQGITTTYTDLMISTSGGDYEPYTGGNPAPNPDYPYPVNVVTGDNEVKIFHTLFDKSTIHSGDIKGGNSSIRLCSRQNLWLEVGTYVFRTNMVSPYKFNIGIQNVGVPPLSNYPTFSYSSDWVVPTSNDFVFTLNEAGYFSIQFSNENYGELTVDDVIDYDFILEKETTIKEQNYQINLGSMELCKIGDYQDYLYKENGKWYKYGAIGKVVLDGSEIWVKVRDYVFTNKFDNCLYPTNPDVLMDCLCDNFTRVSNHATWNNYDSLISYYTPAGGRTTVFRYNQTKEISDWTNWLSTHNTTVYYVLAIPTITEITDTTLIEQLDNLEKAYSYDTQTNISQTNQDKPFIISYEAILSLRNVLNS